MKGIMMELTHSNSNQKKPGLYQVAPKVNDYPVFEEPTHIPGNRNQRRQKCLLQIPLI